jgi:cell division protein FtsI/penicillin-binding protein 2
MKNFNISRYTILGIAFSLIFVVIILKIYSLQTGETADRIRQIVKTQYETETRTLYPERGNIYDRWGAMMAGSREVYEVGIDLQSVEDPETIASTVATVLGKEYGLEYADVLKAAQKEYIKGKQVYMLLARNVAPEKIRELEEIEKNYQTRADNYKARKGEKNPSLYGLVWNSGLIRTYPENDLAANVLGFTTFMDKERTVGMFGVEGYYNDLLSGPPITIKVPLYRGPDFKMPEIPKGASIVLTIDRKIQAMTEKELDKALKSTGAVNGVIMVYDPKTGEILAMAATPRMNPNNYYKEYGKIFPDVKPPIAYNKAVDTYEPGSVFKVLTMGAAIDAGLVTPSTTFVDTGREEINGQPFFNWDRGAWGQQTMEGCMEHSLNVCLVWVAKQLKNDRFYKYMSAFGIDRKSNVDLAGEANFPFAKPGDGNWTPVNLGANSFGQSVAVNPVQMVAAVGALANDGKMMAPHVMKAYIKEGHQTEIQPQVISQPISSKAAHDMTEMLARSVESESYDNAKVEGYTLAGKTGTAEIPSEFGYTDSQTNASFVGWGPVENPKFLVYVWLERPKKAIWGSIVAAPVFADVTQKLVVLMDIPPDDVRAQLQTK